jgi:DNA polymerase-1
VACEQEHGETAALAQGALQLASVLRGGLAEEGGLECYERCELPLIPALARMEDVGLGVDTHVLGELADELRERIEAMREEIYDLAGIEVPRSIRLGNLARLFEKRTAFGQAHQDGFLHRR